MSNVVKDVTGSSFDSDVLAADGPVLVFFHAPGSYDSSNITPLADVIAPEYEGKLTVVKVNAEENGEVASRFGIGELPAVALFENGGLADSKSSPMGQRDVITLLPQRS